MYYESQETKTLDHEAKQYLVPPGHARESVWAKMWGVKFV